jgi:putative membrane protein
MIVNARGSVLSLLGWQWRSVALFTAMATAAVVAHRVFEHRWLRLPTLPLAVVGAALGIFVSFRTNSAYARWWEGRQLWGRLINHSRHFASQVLAYLPRAPGGEPTALQRRLVHRHVAYVHALRCALREQPPLDDRDVLAHLGDGERDALRGESNVPHALLHRQFEDLAAAARAGELDELRLQSFDGTFAGLLDAQGGCERIKRTPMPRGYAFVGQELVYAYSVMFPLAIVADTGWATIPISVVVCLGFALIGEVGRVLEDPFTMFWNGLPLTSLATTIEINVRQRLGETDLPAAATPDAHGILM